MKKVEILMSNDFQQIEPGHSDFYSRNPAGSFAGN